ncbi:MAG: UvrD-helicase domain-containing protein, partial [Lentisphaeria bacterium]|nr:UvrD-helicase domain-containing protein [Lentisphaeria bacterium]
MTKEEILAQLNPEQAQAAGTVNGPVLVLAGAGTGKTRVITYRIAYMLASGIAPENILGMTFTNKAAREMRERLEKLVDPAAARKVTLGTFHSFCGRLLRKEISALGYLPGFTIADESDQLGVFKQAGGMLGLGGENFPFGAAFARMSRWKNQLVTPDAANKTAETEFDVLAAQIYEKYQELLELQNLVDFDDMLLLVWRLFTEHPQILKRCQERYRYLLVDEYQDTNGAQFALVKMLAGDTCNLCVVGDDDQSIYSWRGADVGNILDFPYIFPSARVVKLEQNYRSCTSILNAANAVIGVSGSKRHEKKLWSAIGEGTRPRIVALDNGEGEAEYVANMISQLQRQRNEGKAPFSDFAILYRSNQLSRQLEQALRSAGIPYRLFGGQQFFQRREIKDALAYLRLMVNPRDDQSLLRVLASPPRGIGAKAVETLKKKRMEEHESMFGVLCSESFRNTLTKAGALGAAQLAQVYEEYRERFAEPGDISRKAADFLVACGYIDGLQKIYKDINDSVKRRDNIDEFISAIAQYESKSPEPLTLNDYLEACSLMEEEDRDDDENSDAVTLSSIHASKGLEFPVVF